jgi:hypothetical protein
VFVCIVSISPYIRDVILNVNGGFSTQAIDVAFIVRDVHTNGCGVMGMAEKL